MKKIHMCLFSKISEHREATENVETQFMMHNIHEQQTDLESQHCSEQSIQCEKKHSCHECHLSSPSTVNEVVQHFKMSSTNKFHNSQGESEINAKDNADKAIDVSSEESECNTEYLEKNIILQICGRGKNL